MRAALVLAVTLVSVAAAQNPSLPAPPPFSAPAPAPATSEPAPQRPPLENTGKPMVVDFHCSEEDIQASGLSCAADDPCPMYLELTAVEAVGSRILVAGNLHSQSATLYSVLLASDDGAKTWREPYERIRAAVLDQIQFVDFENGWVSGAVMHPLPRDAFLLITADGGKTWRSQPVFEESRFGSIMQFWFNSRTNGSLIIDQGQPGGGGRYELYETTNGGDTWTERSSSEQPAKLRQSSGAVNDDWRLRADASSKAYQVEHRSGEKWSTVARFTVSVGLCKTPEHVAPPDAPPEPQEPPPSRF
jgi:photosystem II stability/assembly factor-like uncharacterized protein